MTSRAILILLFIIVSFQVKSFSQEITVKVSDQSGRAKGASDLTVSAFYIDEDREEHMVYDYTDEDGKVKLKIPPHSKRGSSRVYVEVGNISDKWRADPIFLYTSDQTVYITYKGRNPNWEKLNEKTRTY